MVTAVIVVAVLASCGSFSLGVKRGKQLAWMDFAKNYIVIHKSTIITRKKPIKRKGRTTK